MENSASEIRPGDQRQGTAAAVLETAPVLVCFVAYVGAGWLPSEAPPPIFLATILFMVATVISVALSAVLLRRLPLLPVASAVPLLILGGLGIFLQDDLFIKIRPTIVNLLMGFTLFAGLAFGKALLRPAFGAIMQLDEEGWRKLTFRWAAFCLAMGMANELVWRLLPEAAWVTYDSWGGTALTLLFTAAQYPLLAQHTKV